jgi:hypothetical protein
LVQGIVLPCDRVGQVYDDDDSFQHLCCSSGEHISGRAIIEMTQCLSLVFAGIMENEVFAQCQIEMSIRALALLTLVGVLERSVEYWSL